MNSEVANRCDPHPLVSVVTVTYQHAPFIRPCVESILAQRTSFPFELLIGEDGSTDGTRSICEELAAAHADRIRLFLRDRSDVIHIMGRPTGRANVLALYNDARGKYIAVCPGDDLWTDPDKLQAQVDLMEARPDLVGCFTNGWNERGTERSDYVRSWLKGQAPPAEVGVADLLQGNFIPAMTFLFRRDKLFPLPPQIRTAPVSDHVLVVHLARQGPIAYMDRMAGVRRIHSGGIISMKDALHKLEVNIGTLEAIESLVGPEHEATLEARLIELNEQALQLAIDRGMRGKARGFWRKLRTYRRHKPGVREQVRRGVQLHAPVLARLFHAVLARRQRASRGSGGSSSPGGHLA